MAFSFLSATLSGVRVFFGRRRAAVCTPREIGSSAMVAEKNDFDRTRYSKTKFFHANQSMQKCVSS